MQVSDRAGGAVLVALGAAAAWGGSRLPPVPGQEVGPAAFPLLIGLGLVLCGTLIALGIGRGFEAPGEAAPPAPRGAAWRVLVPPALLLFYVLAANTLGFLLAAALMVAVAAWALGAGPRLVLGLALLAPPLVHLAFAKGLRVPLPEGLLAAPW
ncbi:tripartite tricarboxylate transporter TctB family protein [Roseococcus sp. DSY-14]|uniref:tripartite tricarboxylate transporter TctB family protein n=1 Tax=Roseococcus sp. DSY-14 TaxID=3369650 RepID=UPI00387AA50C